MCLCFGELWSLIYHALTQDIAAICMCTLYYCYNQILLTRIVCQSQLRLNNLILPCSFKVTFNKKYKYFQIRNLRNNLILVYQRVHQNHKNSPLHIYIQYIFGCNYVPPPLKFRRDVLFLPEVSFCLSQKSFPLCTFRTLWRIFL